AAFPGDRRAAAGYRCRAGGALLGGRRSVQGDGRQRVAEGDRARAHEPVSGQYLGQEGFGLALAVDTHEAVTLIAAAVPRRPWTYGRRTRGLQVRLLPGLFLVQERRNFAAQ